MSEQHRHRMKWFQIVVLPIFIGICFYGIAHIVPWELLAAVAVAQFVATIEHAVDEIKKAILANKDVR